MRRANLISVLDRALVIVYRSLPMFVDEIQPWSHPGDEAAETLLKNIVADQKLYAGKIAELILELNSAPNAGSYPMEYTDLHLLSLDYLLQEIAELQQRDVSELSECAAAVSEEGRAKALLEEVLGNARGHLESLEQLLDRMAK